MRSIKKYYILLIILLCNLDQIKAQEIPQFSQYYHEKFLYNPGYTGNTYKFLESAFNVRQMYTGFKGAPLTMNFGIHAPLRYSNNQLGGRFISDKIGYMYTNCLWMYYARKFYFGEFHTLSVGAELGIIDRGINYNKLLLDDYSDEVFNNNMYDYESNYMRNIGNEKYYDGGDFLYNYRFFKTPDVGVGVFYRYKEWYAGASIRHLVQFRYGVNLKYERDLYARLRRHYFFMGGTSIDVTSDFSVKPGYLIKMTNTNDIQADVNAMVEYKKTLGIGLAYRTETAIIPNIYYRSKDNILIGYSYDISTNAFNRYHGGNHEIVFVYLMNLYKPAIKKIVDPRYYK